MICLSLSISGPMSFFIPSSRSVLLRRGSERTVRWASGCWPRLIHHTHLLNSLYPRRIRIQLEPKNPADATSTCKCMSLANFLSKFSDMQLEKQFCLKFWGTEITAKPAQPAHFSPLTSQEISLEIELKHLISEKKPVIYEESWFLLWLEMAYEL